MDKVLEQRVFKISSLSHLSNPDVVRRLKLSRCASSFGQATLDQRWGMGKRYEERSQTEAMRKKKQREKKMGEGLERRRSSLSTPPPARSPFFPRPFSSSGRECQPFSANADNSD